VGATRCVTRLGVCSLCDLCVSAVSPVGHRLESLWHWGDYLPGGNAAPAMGAETGRIAYVVGARHVVPAPGVVERGPRRPAYKPGCLP